ncbi:MAG: glycosyltransferase family 2 protein, partial [Cyanobacteria bacterium J06623_7]
MMTEQASLISVVLVFYNVSVINLEAAIKSVLAQDYDCWELLLVDDGSTNHSRELAHNYARLYPHHIHYLTHERHLNLGVSASYNLGIARAKGNYLAFL